MSIGVGARRQAHGFGRRGPAPTRSNRLSNAALATFAALGLLAMTPVHALACGQCVEDKVAATFDAAVRAHAAHIGHVVVYAEVRGPAAGGPSELRDFIAHSVATTSGVDAGTVRVSLEPPAAAFACDSRMAARVVAAVNPRLARRRLSLTVIKIDDGRTTALKSSAGVAAAR